MGQEYKRGAEMLWGFNVARESFFTDGEREKGNIWSQAVAKSPIGYLGRGVVEKEGGNVSSFRERKV